MYEYSTLNIVSKTLIIKIIFFDIIVGEVKIIQCSKS